MTRNSRNPKNSPPLSQPEGIKKMRNTDWLVVDQLPVTSHATAILTPRTNPSPQQPAPPSRKKSLTSV